MLITRECDYAVRIVRALAGGEKLCVNQICEKEDLTPAFVYKILKKLEKKEIVKSFRGSNGGYALKKSLWVNLPFWMYIWLWNRIFI